MSAATEPELLRPKDCSTTTRAFPIRIPESESAGLSAAGSRQLSRRTVGRDGWREYFFENVSDDCALCGRGIIADVKTREPIVSSSTDSDNHLHAP